MNDDNLLFGSDDLERLKRRQQVDGWVDHQLGALLARYKAQAEAISNLRSRMTAEEWVRFDAPLTLVHPPTVPPRHVSGPRQQQVEGHGLIYLTLASGADRWDENGTLKEEGTLWWLVTDWLGDLYAALTKEVADWCFDNIGPYRTINHIPSPVNVCITGTDSWRIEFETHSDMTFFKLR